jgi:hypothetical protein
MAAQVRAREKATDLMHEPMSVAVLAVANNRHGPHKVPSIARAAALVDWIHPRGAIVIYTRLLPRRQNSALP